jgi:hypothetical protein
MVSFLDVMIRAIRVDLLWRHGVRHNTVQLIQEKLMTTPLSKESGQGITNGVVAEMAVIAAQSASSEKTAAS